MEKRKKIVKKEKEEEVVELACWYLVKIRDPSSRASGHGVYRETQAKFANG
jgi:hypothetical protein